MIKLVSKIMVGVGAAILGCSMLAFPAFADPDEAADTTDATMTAPAQTTAFDPQQYIATYTYTAAYDYYSDPYYDTDGNAELMQRVIYASSQLQFLSVTTKDGHVFYIIIDYTDTDGDNVYFLNKVDDFDLYSLLYSGGDDDESALDSYKKQQSSETGSATGTGNGQTNTTTETSKITESADRSSGGLSNETLIYLVCGGIFVLVLAVIVVVKIRSMKKSRLAPNDDFADDDDQDDDIDGGEVEIQ